MMTLYFEFQARIKLLALEGRESRNEGCEDRFAYSGFRVDL